MGKGGGGKKARVDVALGPRYLEMLNDMTSATGHSRTEILRDALAFKHWADEIRQEGGRLLVERSDGTIKEVVVRP